MQRGLDGKSSKTMEAMKQPSKETLKKIRDISAIEEFGYLKLVLHFPDNT